MTSNAQSLLQYWNLPTESDLRRLEVGILNETFVVKTDIPNSFSGYTKAREAILLE